MGIYVIYFSVSMFECWYACLFTCMNESMYLCVRSLIIMQSRIIKYLIYDFLLTIMIMTRYKHVFIIAFINMCNSVVIV